MRHRAHEHDRAARSDPRHDHGLDVRDRRGLRRSALLLAASEVDFEASLLRRAVLAPLAVALGLAALLLVFGTGPGTSGVKVNLFGVQPVEVIRLLVVFALAAYFARRLDVLRELSEAADSVTALAALRAAAALEGRPPGRGARWRSCSRSSSCRRISGPALVLVVRGPGAVRRGARPGGVRVRRLSPCSSPASPSAYWIGHPATVGQRVAIWLDPWNNGVPGGNQIAHGLWALSTGAHWGSGPGLGSPQSIPAGHTDFILAAIGEELGFVGVAVVVALYAHPVLALPAHRGACARRLHGAPRDRCRAGARRAGVRHRQRRARAPAAVRRRDAVSQLRAVVDARQPARRGRRARRGEPARPGPHAPHRPLPDAAAVLGAVHRWPSSRAPAWVQVVHADEVATAPSLSEQATAATGSNTTRG